MAKLTARVASLENTVEAINQQSMRNNLIFYNLPEEEQDDPREVIMNFMRSEMQIPSDMIYSRQNLAGEIRVDVVHRMGQKRDKTRPLIVRYMSHSGRNIVMSYAKVLRSTSFAVSEQLPTATREKRQAQIPMLVSLRKQARSEGSNKNIKLVKDKLIVDGSECMEALEKNPVDCSFPA